MSSLDNVVAWTWIGLIVIFVVVSLITRRDKRPSDAERDHKK